MSDPSSYLKWLDNENNGLVSIRYVNGLMVKVKYLPADYLVYKELKSIDSPISKIQQDSIRKLYENSVSFLMSIGPDERKVEGSDVMYKNVAEYKEYAERVQTMNFDMEQYVTLRAGKNEYKPVLSAMENTYGLENKRNIIFVFVPKEIDDKSIRLSENMEFVYNDEMFDMGKNYFVFNRNKINNVPAFSYQPERK